MTDSTSILRVLDTVRPDKVYNLTVQSYIHVSFDSPEHTENEDVIGNLRMLDVIRSTGSNRFYQVFNFRALWLYTRSYSV